MLTAEELKALDERIGNNANKLIGKRTKSYYSFKENEAGRKPASFHNCVLPEISDALYNSDGQWPLWIDDVVSGVSRLDWYRRGSRSVPLSAKDILRCFAHLEVIDASQISHLLGVAERQAQRYFKACLLCHERLIEGYCDLSIRTMRYPSVFIYPREYVPLSDDSVAI
ncbi:hypothetical protein D3C80_440350 [compost metagenome]